MFPEFRELQELRDLEFFMRRPPRRIIVDRMNLFELPDHEFIMRFRLSKDSVSRVLHLIEPHLPQHLNNRGEQLIQYIFRTHYNSSTLCNMAIMFNKV